jgi:hypothetical protein
MTCSWFVLVLIWKGLRAGSHREVYQHDSWFGSKSCFTKDTLSSYFLKIILIFRPYPNIGGPSFDLWFANADEICRLSKRREFQELAAGRNEIDDA